MPFYSRMRKLSAAKLTKYKQGVVNLVAYEVIPGETEFDPPTTLATLTPVDAVVEGAGEEWADGETIRRTDLQIQIAAIDEAPEVGDVVQVDGAPLTIRAVENIPGAGDPASYLLFAGN